MSLHIVHSSRLATLMKRTESAKIEAIQKWVQGVNCAASGGNLPGFTSNSDAQLTFLSESRCHIWNAWDYK